MLFLLDAYEEFGGVLCGYVKVSFVRMPVARRGGDEQVLGVKKVVQVFLGVCSAEANRKAFFCGVSSSGLFDSHSIDFIDEGWVAFSGIARETGLGDFLGTSCS